MKTFNEYVKKQGDNIDATIAMLQVSAETFKGQEKTDLLCCIRDLQEIAYRQKKNSVDANSS